MSRERGEEQKEREREENNKCKGQSRNNGAAEGVQLSAPAGFRNYREKEERA